MPPGGSRGFTGRARDDVGAGVPRYLNSPRTALYDKGAILFGLRENRAALAADGVPVLTEGPLDTIAVSASCSGRMVGLAPCGTALTASQARVLGQAARLKETGVRMAFDGDAAGLRAAVRAYRLLAPVASRLSAVVLPPGQDPAGILSRDGPAALADALETRSRPLADLVVDVELRRWGRCLGYETGRISALHAWRLWWPGFARMTSRGRSRGWRTASLLTTTSSRRLSPMLLAALLAAI